ncbi:MAG: hypothetical protein NTY77_04140 [Elusimicrobia bacterium]|nr:hypothetical protein [Elusimicrobiota bacterium]
MKKTTILILACALLVPALAALAQEEGGPPQGEGPEGRPPMDLGMPTEHPMTSARFADMLTQRLELSDEQKAKVQSAIAGSKEGLKKKFAEIQKVRKEMEALEKDLWGKIGAALTEEQKRTLDEMQRMRPGGPGGPGMRRGGEGGQQGGMRPGGRGRGRRGPGRTGQGGGQQQPQQGPQEEPGGDQ